jgi:D-methionine transport system ATP-binding protein
MSQGENAVPAIRLEGVSKRFITENGTVDALQDINLSIESGQIFGIIGLSGAGKSTLVRCINYLEKPTSGEVYINGQALSSLNRRELLSLRRKIGMIFQHFNLLNQRNALGNVLYPLEIAGHPKEEARKVANELLERVGLGEKAKAYPSQLSGGQKQRVAIARALASSPSILLCDEATSALDPATTESIFRLIKELGEQLQLTVVIITHDMSVIESVCTHYALIQDGRVHTTGVVNDVSKENLSKSILQIYEADLFRGTRCCPTDDTSADSNKS